MTDALSQSKEDTLLRSVGKGASKPSIGVETDVDVISYNCSSQERALRRKLPALEIINEQFTHHFSTSFFDFLKKPVEVSTQAINIQSFSEYTGSLSSTANINVVRFFSLKGQALVVMDSQFIFMVVDHFFGGNGQFVNKTEGRDFSPTERRVISLIMDFLVKDLQEAWKPVMDVDMEHVNSEISPKASHIIDLSELVMVSTTFVEIKGGSGKIDIVLPHSVIGQVNGL